MKPFFIFLFILLSVNIVLAIDCNQLDKKELCSEIKNSNITNSEKDYLIQGIINDSENFPSYDFVRDWNLKVNVSGENTTKYNQGYIKNAWVKTLAVMPSVLENNTLYCSSNGGVLSAYNHNVEIPNTLIGDDCRTDYNLIENKGILNLYANNNYQGSGKLINFTINKDTNFKSKYDISVKTDINHYKWVDYCCQSSYRGCTRWCKRCDFKYTEHKVDSLEISDNISTKYYNPNTTADFTAKDKYSGVTKGILSANNFTSFSLDFSNSYLKEYDYIYSIIWNTNNILTVKAEPNKRIEQKNLFYEGNESYNIAVKDETNCKINVFNHFTNKTIPCNLNFNNLNITIDTDKLVYEPNETIKVIITPSNTYFNITYANKTITAKDTVTLTAVYPYNKISVIYNDKSYEKVIHVKDEASLTLLFSLSIFGSVNYTIMGLIKKYWGVIA